MSEGLRIERTGNIPTWKVQYLQYKTKFYGRYWRNKAQTFSLFINRPMPTFSYKHWRPNHSLTTIAQKPVTESNVRNVKTSQPSLIWSKSKTERNGGNKKWLDGSSIAMSFIDCSLFLQHFKHFYTYLEIFLVQQLIEMIVNLEMKFFLFYASWLNFWIDGCRVLFAAADVVFFPHFFPIQLDVVLAAVIHQVWFCFENRLLRAFNWNGRYCPSIHAILYSNLIQSAKMFYYHLC